MQLTQELIKKHFNYDPITGILQRSDLKSAVPIYSQYVSFKGKLITTARIIHQYMMHEPPPKLIMRLDRDPANNKWSNFTTTTEHGIMKVRKNASAQKRPVELSANEMQQIFRLEVAPKVVTKTNPKTKEQREVTVKSYKLWFLLPPTPVLCTKPTLKFKWQGITYIRTRTHVIMRMQYIDGAKRSKEQGFRLVSEKSEASRAKRHETQRIKALRKNDAEPV